MCHIINFLVYPVVESVLNGLIVLKAHKCFKYLFLQAFINSIKNTMAQKCTTNTNIYIFVSQIYYIYFHPWEWCIINRLEDFLNP